MKIKVSLHDPLEVPDETLAFAVIMARHRDQWVFVRHRERATWEIPGGHRERGETIGQTAVRELYEESGAVASTLTPVGAYSVTREGRQSFGMLYYAEVDALGRLPDSEIAEVRLLDALPEGLTYPEIQPILFRATITALNAGKPGGSTGQTEGTGILGRLASTLGRRDEGPNQQLARELVALGDTAAVAELIGGLFSGAAAAQSDCIKVLYEIGYLRPELIAGHADAFLRLLSSRNNRLVWGAMIALAAIAPLAGEVISAGIGQIWRAMESGSVITIDNGVRVLAAVEAAQPGQNAAIQQYLLRHLLECPAKQIPQHAESMLPAIGRHNREMFRTAVLAREPELSPSQLARIQKFYRALSSLT